MFKSIIIKDFRQFQNQKILLGNYITVLAGRNSTGKSTILGLLGNSSEIKKNVGETYTHGRFRAEFSEIIKGSRKFDKTGSDLFKIITEDKSGNQIECDFRTTWQKYSKKDDDASRFRLIPRWKKGDGSITESKLEYPVLYLGLSRLFPIGEASRIGIKKPRIRFDSEDHEKWFVNHYKRILSVNEDVRAVTDYSIGETDKKIGVGVTTDKYDYLTNSSGQDNLGQILLNILSFKRIRDSLGDNWQGGLLLIDEIDATLHPVAQNRLLDLLIREAKTSDFQVVFTTHSLSLLKHVAQKAEYNNIDTSNQNIELYYFTTANRVLEIRRNPSFHSMENDLMIQSVINNSHKVKVYSEDHETRWFLKQLIGDYASYIDLLDVKTGCHSLMTMYKSDLEYFTRTLIVLDGDVDQKTLDTVPEVTRQKFCNILLLPGQKRPEQVIYEYIIKLDKDHEFWKIAEQYDATWQYFKENGPDSQKYKKVKDKDRDSYKRWFSDHEELLDVSKIGEYWVRDNPKDSENFLKNFKISYNSVARRVMAPLIKE